MNFYPFIISFISGLSTLIGYFSIYIKYNKNRIIKNSLALAAGVMLCVSIIELIPEGIKLLNKYNNLFLIGITTITIGMLLPITINKIIKKEGLYKLGILSTIAIIMHNIPEGIITYLTSVQNIKLGINIALAIAMHNIPEGITIAVPIYYSTKDKKKAFKMVLISALSEPFGAILAYILLRNIITDKIIGIILLLVAGIMTYLSIIELLPKALKYKEKKKTLIFFIIGLIIMYISVKITK
ncbi:MAG: ZIP family metal transporter [Bacilli bacterium]|nr:ZIP family metal transporter [Bacilli bacterium]